MTLLSLDDKYSKELLPLNMELLPGREPSRLSNFLSQRARLKGYTTKINEFVKINRIVIYVKPTYTSFPM